MGTIGQQERFEEMRCAIIVTLRLVKLHGAPQKAALGFAGPLFRPANSTAIIAEHLLSQELTT
jgi:hypothetical protein